MEEREDGEEEEEERPAGGERGRAGSEDEDLGRVANVLVLVEVSGLLRVTANSEPKV